MKISEQFIDGEGDTFHVKKTYDFDPALKHVRQARDRGHKLGEMYHIGSVPKGLWEIWAKEAGVSPSDNAAMSEIVKRKLLSGEYSALRNYEGTY